MNAFWKDFLLIIIEAVILSFILYDIIRKSKNPTDRLSLFLMSILLIIIFVHLIINSKRMLYNFGLWFHCRH